MYNLPSINRPRNTGLNESFDVAPNRKNYSHGYSPMRAAIINKTPEKFTKSSGKSNSKPILEPLGNNPSNKSFESPLSAYLAKTQKPNTNVKTLNERIGADYFQQFALGPNTKHNISLVKYSQPQQPSPSLLKHNKTNSHDFSENKVYSPQQSRTKLVRIKQDRLEISYPVLNQYNEDQFIDFEDIAAEYYHRTLKMREGDTRDPKRFKQKFMNKFFPVDPNKK